MMSSKTSVAKTATSKPFRPRVVVPLHGSSGLKRVGRSRWIAAQPDAPITATVDQLLRQGEIKFSDPVDMKMLGKRSVEVADGNVTSYEMVGKFSPKLLTNTILGNREADRTAPQASNAFIKFELAFSAAQIIQMITTGSEASKALIKDGRWNLFPVQVSPTEVATFFVWWHCKRWNIRVSNLGLGRGTDPGNGVIHLRNNPKHKK